MLNKNIGYISPDYLYKYNSPINTEAILKIRQESKIKFSEVSRGQWWPSDCTDRNET